MNAAVAAAIGDNNPPDLPPVTARLTEDHAALLARRDELLAGMARVPDEVADEDTAGRVADFAKQIAAAIKNADTARIAEKEPFLDGGRQVDGFFKKVTDPLDRAKKGLADRLTAYQRKVAEAERLRREEEERRRKVEADRIAAEAAAKAAAAADDAGLDDAIAAEAAADQAMADAVLAERAADAKPAELARTRGDFGAVSSLRTFWDVEIVDARVLDLEALRPHIPVGAMEQACRSFVKAGGRTLVGARIFENTRSVIR